MSNRCLNFTVTEKLFFKNLPGTREPLHSFCPPCPAHCYAAVYHAYIRLVARKSYVHSTHRSSRPASALQSTKLLIPHRTSQQGSLCRPSHLFPVGFSPYSICAICCGFVVQQIHKSRDVLWTCCGLLVMDLLCTCYTY